MTQAKRKAINRADSIVSVSHATKTDFERFYPDADVSVTVAPNGVRCDIFQPQSGIAITSFRERYLTSAHSIKNEVNHKPYILVVGRRAGYKNIWLLYRLLQRWDLYKSVQHANTTSQTGQSGSLNQLNPPLLVIVGPSLDVEERKMLDGLQYCAIENLPDSELAKAYSGAAALVCV